jgi:excisionase family DNA binding protein
MNIIITTPEDLKAIISAALNEFLASNSSQSQVPKKLYSKTEAANYLKIPEDTIYQLTSKRRIPFSKVGRRLVFRQEDLDKWLQDNRQMTRKEIEDSIKNPKSFRS